MPWWDEKKDSEKHRADRAEAEVRELERGLKAVSKEIRKLLGEDVNDVPPNLQQYVDRARRN